MKRTKTAAVLFAASLLFAFILTACQPQDKKISVEFFADGELYYAVEIEKDALINFPKDPEKDGYIFKGWECGESLEKIVFNAVWSEKEDGEIQNRVVEREAEDFIIGLLGAYGNQIITYDGTNHAEEYAELTYELYKISESAYKIEGIASAELIIKKNGAVVTAIRDAGTYFLTAAVRTLNDGASGWVFADGSTEKTAEWTYTVAPKVVTASGIYALDKTRDASREVSVNSANMIITGIILGDDVSVEISPIGNANTSKIGTHKVTIFTYESGADALNYTYTYDAVTVNINAKDDLPDEEGIEIDVDDEQEIYEVLADFEVRSGSKVYDGKDAFADLVGDLADELEAIRRMIGIASAEIEVKKDGVGVGVIKDVGEYTLTLKVKTIVGTPGWIFSDGSGEKSAQWTYTIRTRELNDAIAYADEARIVGILDGMTDGGRVYDGIDRLLEYKNTFAAALLEIEEINGILDAELKVFEEDGEVAATMKNAGLYRVVLVARTAGETTFADGSREKSKEIIYTVEKKTVTVSGITALDGFYYEGNLSVELEFASGSILVDGVIDGDDLLIIVDMLGEMDDDLPGVNKPVKVSATVSGADADNYEVVFEAVTVTIDP
jgi:hypothetical protein